MRFRRLSAAGASALSIWECIGTGGALEAFLGALPAVDRFRLAEFGEPVFDQGLLWNRGLVAHGGELRVELHLHGGHGVAAALRHWLSDAGASEEPAAAADDATAAFLRASTPASAAAWARLQEGAFETHLESLHGLPEPTRKAALAELRATVPWAEALEAPQRVVLAGPPNAGKSTLLNRWLRRQRVVVSEHAGTTRDAVSALVPVGEEPHGFLVQLVDTAGLWTEAEGVDQAAVELARREIARAWRVIWVFDAALEPNPALVASWHEARRETDLQLLNRCDMGEDWCPEDRLGGTWLRGHDSAELPAQLEVELLRSLGPPPPVGALLPMGERRRALLAAWGDGGE